MLIRYAIRELVSTTTYCGDTLSAKKQQLGLNKGQLFEIPLICSLMLKLIGQAEQLLPFYQNGKSSGRQ